MLRKIKSNIPNLSDYTKRIINFCIVYIFLATIVVCELIRQNEWSIQNIVNAPGIVIFLYLYPVIYILLIFLFYNDEKEKYYDTVNYYNMQFLGEDRLRYAKRARIPKEVWQVFVFIFISSLAIIGGDKIDWDRCMEIYEGIREEIADHDPINMVLGINAFVLGLYQLMVSYLDKRCMFFDVEELPGIRKCRGWIAASVSILFIYVFSYFIISYNDWQIKYLYYLEIIWFACFFVIVMECIYMFYIQIYWEKRVIKNIEKYYGTEKILMLPQRKWYKGNAIKKLTYLINRYQKKIKKIDIDNIEKIDFACILSRDYDNDKRARDKYIFVAFMISLFVLAIIPGLTVMMNQAMRLTYAMTLLLGLLPIIGLCFDHRRLYENYKLINSIIYTARWGYYIKIRNKKSALYVSSHDYTHSRYRELILSLKRIVCFYHLAVNMTYEDEEDFGSCGIDDICAYIMDMKQRREKIDFMISPLLVCACLYEGKNQNTRMYISDTLKRANLKKKVINKMIELSILLLRDIHGDDKTFQEDGYREKMLLLLGE